ncbi:MAG: hypothetical protein GF411_10710 [Candidatus Lokiarchaeota archaeon]|nr:hypothetical protein [Candidatus Lokiarchaeota archaeon]
MGGLWNHNITIVVYDNGGRYTSDTDIIEALAAVEPTATTSTTSGGSLWNFTPMEILMMVVGGSLLIIALIALVRRRRE